MPQESRTIGGWLREAAYLQRNPSLGWTGAMRFVAIRCALREAGISSEAFDGWMARIQRQEQAATQLNHIDYTRLDEAQASASQ